MNIDMTTIGHLSIDFIWSDKLTIGPMLGGSPTYVSLTGSTLGSKTSIISKVGDDFPLKYIKLLEECGVDVSNIEIIDKSLTTSYTLKNVTKNCRNLLLRAKAPMLEENDIPNHLESKTVLVSPIANEVSPEVVFKLRNLVDFLALDLQGFLRYFKSNGKMYLDKISRPETLYLADIIKGSKKEMSIAVGTTLTNKIMSKLAGNGIKIVLVTRGPQGILLYSEGKIFSIPSFKSIVVDTTGAGDAFMGAFLTEYIYGEEPLWCSCIGAAAASFVIEYFGAQGFGSKKSVYERAKVLYDKAKVVT